MGNNSSTKSTDEEFINNRVAELVDLLISLRQADTVPRALDLNNISNHLAGIKNYHDNKARWLVPFMFPVEGYDNRLHKNQSNTLLSLITDETLTDRGCLCDIEEDDIPKCDMCVLIVKAPARYIKEFRSKVYEKHDGKALNAEDVLLKSLSKQLGLEGPNRISYAFVPDERGLKICLLLLNMPTMKLKDLMKRAYSTENDTQVFEFDERKWRHGIEHGSETLKALIEEHGKTHEDVTREFLGKANIRDLTDDYIKLYQSIL